MKCGMGYKRKIFIIHSMKLMKTSKIEKSRKRSINMLFKKVEGSIKSYPRVESGGNSGTD